MNIVKSALGYYETSGNPKLADCIIGHSFGTLTGESSVNRALAEYILGLCEGRPIIADRMLVEAFPGKDEQVAHVVEGPISNLIGQGVGSWGTLVEACAYMQEHGLYLPAMVAQAHHIGRVVMQAEKLGITSVVPPDVPRTFDGASGQIWTRSVLWWVPREIGGSLVLRAQGKL
jgi:hypothetical protein